MTRFITRLALLACLALLLAGCWSTEQIPLSQYPPLTHAAGVRTRSGSEIRFVPRGAHVLHDTLYAMSRDGPVRMSADSVELVAVRKFSWGRAIGLYLVAGLAVMAIAHPFPPTQ
jgi:hypothetical protein